MVMRAEPPSWVGSSYKPEQDEHIRSEERQKNGECHHYANQAIIGHWPLPRCRVDPPGKEAQSGRVVSRSPVGGGGGSADQKILNAARWG
jgi:hypothetical protein